MTRDSSDIRGCEDSGPTIICGSRGQHAFFSAALKLCDNVIQRIWLNILLPFCFSTRFFSQFICIGIRELVSQQASTCMFIRSVFSRISPLTVSSEHSCWFFHLFFITIFVFFSGCGYSSYFYKGQRPIVWDHKCLTD